MDSVYKISNFERKGQPFNLQQFASHLNLFVTSIANAMKLFLARFAKHGQRKAGVNQQDYRS
jgi:hypothetical protein